MKKAGLFSILILAVSALSTAARAQDMAKKEAPKPAASASQAVLDQWNDIGRKLIAMAEDFPEDKFDFKPAATMQSFAQRLIHAAHANDFFINGVMGKKMPAMDDPKREEFKTKADVVAFVKKSFADGAAAIKAKGDKGMSDTVVDPFSNDPDSHRRFCLWVHRTLRRSLRAAHCLLPRGWDGASGVASEEVTGLWWAAKTGGMVSAASPHDAMPFCHG